MSNISLNGIAITSKDSVGADVRIGDSLPIRIEQSNVPLFRGRATIKRIEPSSFGSILGLQFDDSFIDIPALQRRAAQARMRAQFATLQPTQHDHVSGEYRMLCADVLSTLRSYRSFLAQQNDLFETEKTEANGAFELCVEQIVPQWRALWARGNEAVRAAAGDENDMRALKDFTKRVLTPEFCTAPIWAQSHHKPLGYPGDFVMIKSVHNWKREGASHYDQLLHRLGLDAFEYLKTRDDVIVDAVMRLIGRQPSGDTMHILGLGNGPAREVPRILKQTARGDIKVAYSLLAQDEQALQHAYKTSYPLTAGHGAGASVTCINASFADVHRGGLASHGIQQQDIAYAFDQFDYLTDARARDMIKSVFDLVKPGGLLIIGNVSDGDASTVWPAGCIADWPMTYRTAAEMLTWTDELTKQSAWTETDSTGHYRLLFIRKVND